MLHLAAHGRLDEIAPNSSSIVLAGDDDLTASDLIGLDIGAATCRRAMAIGAEPSSR
jgi:CHAT domain-containing protein